MYFMDFLGGPVAPQCRYFLSGDNSYLKNFVIDRLSTSTGRKIARVSSVKEMVPEGLFREPTLYVLGSKSNPKTFQDFMVKLSSSKMGKTYSNAGFTEVTCSSLFPSQAGQFASFLLGEYGLKKGPARTIAKICNYDPATISNTVLAISYGGKDFTEPELVELSRGLYIPDTYKIIDYFIEGEYVSFINHTRASRVNIHEILWSLAGALLKLQSVKIDYMSAKTWYQKKMANAHSRLSPYRFEVIIPYVSDLCNSYGLSKDVILLRIQKLIFYLEGKSLVL